MPIFGGVMRRYLLTALVWTLSTSAIADEGPFVFEFEELAPGVWAGVRPDGPRFPVMGNTTFVISEEGVVVYDGGGMPAMSEQVIAKIRSLTDLPVTHVVTSHWHGDHNFGVYRFGEEFPNVQFIAHEFTREVMNSSRINYIDRERGFVEENLERFNKIVETGVDDEGNAVSDIGRAGYAQTILHRDVIDRDFLRAKVTPPNIVFSDKYVIESGARNIELLFLGHGNTAGDIVMWLPDEKIVATGDIVVLPSPYAFNVPPRAWSQTLRNINALDYEILVPGHGEIQKDTSYVDLIIEASDSIADQRDAMLAEGMTNEEVQAALDFSAFEERFTHGDEHVKTYYDAYFVDAFRLAATKALTGEPMVQPPPPESVPFDDERWHIEAVESEVVDYLGQQALRIKGGHALLGDTDIRNGLVEYDIAITPQRGFAGLIFRAQDELNHEHFYIRPHQSGNPDANQYTPVFDGNAAWQLYYGPKYAAPVKYKFNEWMHVKILFAGSKAEVYIDSDEPVLRIDDLRREEHNGMIGVNSANFSAVHFANFKFTELANAYQFPDSGADEPAAEEGVIQAWQISEAFDGKSLAGAAGLKTKNAADHTWSAVTAESTGITNLSAVHGLNEGADTVYARHIINGEKGSHKLLTFGYSDQASVYLNGTLIYRGNNGYMTRDYRYLGTIGMFDSVVLPLEKGDNELWIAVTEAFGGWGVMGKVSDF
jgi:glyoxylase-like metal-dependent hydrolase (beta-lactamase superfamily II)